MVTTVSLIQGNKNTSTTNQTATTITVTLFKTNRNRVVTVHFNIIIT